MKWLAMLAVASLGGCQMPPKSGAVDGGPGNQLPLDGGSGFAHLVFHVTDAESRLPMPSRVIFRPPPGSGFADSITSGTPDVGSPGAATGAFVTPGVVGSPEGVLLQTGLGVVPVPAGHYELFITRGPEWEAVDTAVDVGVGEVREVNAVLDRSVDTRGWVAADMHLHTSNSADSRMPPDRRIISMASSGVEFVVPTDHHVVTDLAPLIAALGYGPDVMGTIPGNELNFREGHAGVYPVPYDGNAPHGGSPAWSPSCGTVAGSNCMNDTQAFPYFRSLSASSVVTLNHAWWPGSDLGYFTNIAWGEGTANPPPAPLRSAGLFDAMEVLNGFWTREDAESRLVADWFYLLSQGLKVTAIGSSDSHKINWVRSGFPRSWLRLPDARPGDIGGAAFAEAIRNQRAIASTGPFVTVTVDGAQIGDTVVPNTTGQVTIDLTVDAPGWMQVDTVKVYVGAVEKQSFPVTPGHRPVMHTSFVQAITGDTYVVVLATGKTPLPPDVVGEYSRLNGWEMLPWAITNPVFIDANGDGQWHPQARWSGPPIPPPPGARPAPSRDNRPLAVPLDCDPRSPMYEPGLNDLWSPEREVMPLLYP
jgi:hypothetical protein